MSRINFSLYLILLGSITLSLAACEDSTPPKRETMMVSAGESNAQAGELSAGEAPNMAGDAAAGVTAGVTAGITAGMTEPTAGESLIEGDVSCAPDQRFCLDEQTSARCGGDGASVTALDPCAVGQGCVPLTGECQEQVCTPYESTCADERASLTCNPSGTQQVLLACSGDTTCIDGQCISPACLPQVLFMLDGSSSMVSEWDRVRGSVNAVINNNPQVSYGMLTFPVSFGCSTATGWPNVPMSSEAGPLMQSWFSSNGPAGGATPLISTMEWVAENADTLYPSPNTRSLVIMTEGLDRCSCDLDDDDFFGQDEYEECLVEELGAATRALVAQGIKVYVVGYRFLESAEVLNVIAQEGGTDFDQFIYAGSEETLTNAFESVVTNIKLCQ